MSPSIKLAAAHMDHAIVSMLNLWDTRHENIGSFQRHLAIVGPGATW